MTQRDIEILHERMKSLYDQKKSQAEQLDRIEELARATNGRVKELELWRAKWQGAEFTSRFIWLLIGGVAAAVVIEVLRGM
jgi:hypothetical protein